MEPYASFPRTRLRRNRAHDWSRRLVAEHHLSVNDLILPLFVQEGANVRTPIATLPGIDRLSIDLLVERAQKAADTGIPALALFPATPPEHKNEGAEEAFNPDNLLCRAIAAVKKAVPNIGIITDVALDPYTSHGHDGFLRNGEIVNDETVEALCRQAIVQAGAGADIVAPSDMMDGRVGRIRDALDAEGFTHVGILAYAVKYASAFYGPFRDAVGSKSNLKGADKRSYQMDPANTREALREVRLDIAEGADMVMVKPGMPYLDIVRTLSQECDVPVFAYQVSGEYAMIKAAALAGALDEKAAFLESLIGFKRAGASAVVTYAALDVANWIHAPKATIACP